MKRVQRAAAGWAAAAAWAAAGAVLALLACAAADAITPLPALGWIATATYLIVSNALLIAGLRRRGASRFGQANIVTSLRSSVVGAITGLVVASAFAAVPVPLLVALIVPALALDAVDGWVARRTGSASELGARFDMEVDAFLLLVLSAYVAGSMGLWVLAIGAMRYLFVLVGWAVPWMRRQLPYRYWRKVVTAVAGIALALAVSGLLPGVDVVLVGVALLLLLESFGRDVLWLIGRAELKPRVSGAGGRDWSRREG
ncbi:CDP-alcohol phosphatidyltransferase [Leifsonia sp. Root227]|uniref:CDP-alcohol phosphatidyltransferase family protein n=1 Tax=Leifsonia sp. Root227 TaxID=1736496 RepID=UPI0007015272|nr:CDP-alcohol phosphatidyltransferase family protein [Leifsonia sp. Root227]KRC51693.1 CDP-alcohol phosphatidyltransferase [Leifsonia sp. Root227]